MSKVKEPVQTEAVQEVVGGFLSALEKGEDWRPYAQVSMRKSLVNPMISLFDQHEVLGTTPLKGPYRPGRAKLVMVRIRVYGGPGGQQWLRGRLAVIKEDVPLLDGEGAPILDEEGEPTIGAEWGVAPTSWSWLED